MVEIFTATKSRWRAVYDLDLYAPGTKFLRSADAYSVNKCCTAV